MDQRISSRENTTGEANRRMRLISCNPLQFDLFIPYFSDLPFRDQRETMERPFFSLAKRKRLKAIEYMSPDNSVWVKVEAVPTYGMATIWDADVLIWAASVITDMRERGINEIPRSLHFHPYDLLKTIQRSIGGTHYDRLRAALDRLQSTTIQTNIRAKGTRRTRRFSWIESWSELVTEDDGNIKGMSLTLSEWLYEGILMDGGVLAVSPDYFKLKGGRERWLYRVARKHAGGNQGVGFTISLPTLFEKSGAEGAYRRFKHELKHICEADPLPEYHLAWNELSASQEPSLTMVRRDSLDFSHPAYQFPLRRDRRTPNHA